RNSGGRPPNCLSVSLWLFFFGLFGLLGLIALFFGRLLGALRFLHFEFASQQLDDGKISAIALTVTKLDNAAITTVTIGKSRCDGIEHLFCDGLPQKERMQLASSMKVVPFSERDHLFRERPDFFRFRQRRH